MKIAILQLGGILLTSLQENLGPDRMWDARVLYSCDPGVWVSGTRVGCLAILENLVANTIRHRPDSSEGPARADGALAGQYQPGQRERLNERAPERAMRQSVLSYSYRTKGERVSRKGPRQRFLE